MPQKSGTFFLMGLLALSPSLPAHAGAPADPATSATGAGMITGRVQNIASGQFLINARIGIKGTTQEAFTDGTGTYRLVGVPGGEIVLEVFYTGLDRKEVTVLMAPGEVLERNIELTSADRYGASGPAVTLSPYVIAAGKEREGEALATNEQRFAPNIKTVVATDALGNIVGDSMGEFLKAMPGIMPDESSTGEITNVTLRGLPSSMLDFASDGMPTVSVAGNGLNQRSSYLLGLSLNNTSRIEVTKVPTPSMSAASLGGGINLISKSAFERGAAELRYGLILTGNSHDYTLNKTPDPDETRTRKIKPGFDFDYTLPINKNLGLVVAAMYTDRYTFVYPITTAFETAGTSTGASIENPYRRQFTVNSFPRRQNRLSASLKVDWRVAPNSVLTVGVQKTDSVIRNRQQPWSANVGVNGTPTVAGGIPLTYDKDGFTSGATGRGAITESPSFQTLKSSNHSENINYRFDDGKWKIEASGMFARSAIYAWNFDHHQFFTLAVAMKTPFRVVFSGSQPGTPDGPSSIQVFNNNNQPVDLNNIENYQLATANTFEIASAAETKVGKLDVRRRLDVFAFPTAVQVGTRQSTETRDARRRRSTFTFNGPDGNPATVDSLAPFVMGPYNWDPRVPGFDHVPYVSAQKLSAAWETNPALFTQTPAQIAASEIDRITNSEVLNEKASAFYAQGEAHLLSNRLWLLTGVRYEKTRDRGAGPLVDPNAVFQRDSAGRFLRNAAGARIRKPEAGAAGSLEEVKLTRSERAFHASQSYDGWYPSLHATYNLRENLLLRAAYARTYGRPDMSDIIPNITITEADIGPGQASPDVAPGTITIRNPALKPWTADSYDLSLEQYSATGGVMSVGLFRKDLHDFFGADSRLATAADLELLGLDSQYLGWLVSTQFNAGGARLTGFELNTRQPLGPLGGWGRYFAVFANFTKLKLEGDRSVDFGDFLPEAFNGGFSFNRERVSFMMRWNWKDVRPRNALPAFGDDGRAYQGSRTALDINCGYQLTRHLRLTASIIDALNWNYTALQYGSRTPEYARVVSTTKTGSAISLALRGNF